VPGRNIGFRGFDASDEPRDGLSAHPYGEFAQFVHQHWPTSGAWQIDPDGWKECHRHDLICWSRKDDLARQDRFLWPLRYVSRVSRSRIFPGNDRDPHSGDCWGAVFRMVGVRNQASERMSSRVGVTVKRLQVIDAPLQIRTGSKCCWAILRTLLEPFREAIVGLRRWHLDEPRRLLIERSASDILGLDIDRVLDSRPKCVQSVSSQQRNFRRDRSYSVNHQVPRVSVKLFA